MRYVKETLEYLLIRGKSVRFFVLLLIWLVPSVMIAYGIPLGSALYYVIVPPEYGTWPDVWLVAFRSNLGIASVAIGAIVAVLASACCMGFVIRHFRVGDFKANIGKCMNDYFLPALIHAATIVAGLLLTYTLFSLFSFMWYRFLHGAAYTVLCFVTFIVLFGLFTYVSSSLTMWLPYMCVKGVYNVGAFTSSFYQSRTKQKYLLPGHLVTLLILLVTTVISYFVSNRYVEIVVDAIGISAALVFNFVFSAVAYFGENGLPREDRAVSPFKRR